MLQDQNGPIFYLQHRNIIYNWIKLIYGYKFRDIDKILVATQPNNWPILITINESIPNERIVNSSKM